MQFLTASLLSLALAGSLSAQSRLTNVSVRSTAGANTDTLIVGFTIAGSGEKQMLIRGIGPTLGVFGVTGVVTDPQLRLFNQSNTQVATNDNWGGLGTIATASAAVGAFALANDSRDAVIAQALPTGTYSAHVEATSGSGIALVEAYDADTGTPSSQIVNLSARSTAGTGAGVLTVGFAITGTSTKTVLIRAVGPSLAAFGVSGALANPQLQLFRGSGAVIASNDDWPALAGWGAAFTSVGAFPLSPDTRDAVLLIALPPGTYTAQAAGAGTTTGIALIEVYDVANPPATSIVFTPVEALADATAPGRTTPVATSQARPTYPFELRRAGISGEVVIEFTCNVEGRVQNAFPVRTSHVGFIDSALTAVRQWTFRPGMVNGRPIPTRLQVPIVYTLTEG
ncbi:MAG: TonB family protein [Verrucomicrobiota bacterium]